MSYSSRYQGLTKELETLSSDLLPKTFDPTGEYQPEVLIKTIAYRVLAHAEIESYLEDRAWEVALTATRAWKSQKKPCRTLLGLLAFSGQKMEGPPSTLAPTQPSQMSTWADKLEISNKIDSAMRVFNYAVTNNHGIKEENLLRLLLPIGLDVNHLDQVWLADINSFAERRGEAAHRSAAHYRTKQQVDPKSELQSVHSLLEGLKELDKLIEKLLVEISSP